MNKPRETKLDRQTGRERVSRGPGAGRARAPPRRTCRLDRPAAAATLRHRSNVEPAAQDTSHRSRPVVRDCPPPIHTHTPPEGRRSKDVSLTLRPYLKPALFVSAATCSAALAPVNEVCRLNPLASAHLQDSAAPFVFVFAFNHRRDI